MGLAIQDQGSGMYNNTLYRSEMAVANSCECPQCEDVCYVHWWRNGTVNIRQSTTIHGGKLFGGQMAGD